MILSIANQCNQNCLFCSTKGRKERLGKILFQQAINKTEDSLIISGGEPTLSSNFENCEGVWRDYLKFFGDKEFSPTLEQKNENVN